MRLLVVEDEAKVAHSLVEGLGTEGFDVEAVGSGEEGFFLLNEETFDLVILDLGLPGRDGLDILTTMRRRGLGTPVLILTARDEVDDRIRGLDHGADDYMVKPFAFGELVARIRALLRRGCPDHILRLEAGDLVMDLVTHTVVREGRSIDLTSREFELLECLLRRVGTVVSRETLARTVWNIEPGLIPLDNVIDVNMSRLRSKVDDDGHEPLITTIRGVGFTIEGGPP